MSPLANTIDAPAVDACDVVSSVVAYLSTVAQLVGPPGAGLMGLGAEARIRPGAIPQGTPFGPGSPHITVRRLTTRHARTLLGKRINLDRSFVRVEVWAVTDQERTNLAKAVRDAFTPARFHGYWLGLQIRDVSIEVDADADEDRNDGSEESDWKTLFELSIHHRNPEV